MKSSEMRTGVLFVHGIGAQQRGETLSMYTDAMYSWVRDRIRGITENHKLRGTPRIRITKAWGSQPRPSSHSEVSEDFKNAIDELIKQVEQADGEKSEQIALISDTEEINWHFAFIDVEKNLVPSSKPKKGEKESSLPENGKRKAMPPDEPLIARSGIFFEQPINADEPLTASVDIDWIDQGGEKHKARWLWAESWWANEFDPPNLSKIFKWTPLALLFVAITHFWSRYESTKYNSKWKYYFGVVRIWIAAFFWIFVPILGLPVIYIILALTALADWLPWERLQKAALKLRTIITGVLGDAFSLVEMPLSGAAIQEKVRRDLEWLSKRCDRVLVVGHSQGALLAYLACIRNRPKNVKALITLGAGIRKIRALMAAAESSTHIKFAEGLLLASNIFGVVLVAALTLGITGFLDQKEMWVLGVVSGLSGFITGLFAWSIGFSEVMVTPTEDAFWRNRMNWKKFLWLDIFASHDPVPAGELSQKLQFRLKTDDISPSPPNDYPPSVQITNNCSLLEDHSSYLKNSEECIPTLLWYCALLDGTGSHRWIAPQRDAYSEICYSRKCIVRRSKRMSWVVLLFGITIFLLNPTSGELYNLIKQYTPGETTIKSLISSIRFDPTDMALLFIIVSGFLAVKCVKTFALDRLKSALQQRRYVIKDEKTSDSDFEPGEQRYPALRLFADPSLGEWLGLAITCLFPAIVFLYAVRYMEGWSIVLWTLVSIGLAWVCMVILRAKQQGIWDVKIKNAATEKSNSDHHVHCINKKELKILESYFKKLK